MKRISLLLMAVLCAYSVQALPLPLPPTNSQFGQLISNFTPVSGTGTADVISTVYTANAGGYVYTYEIKNATVNFSWFSVGLIPGAVVANTNWVAGVNDPASWLVVGSPAISVDAQFSMPVGPATNSSLLWFTSPNGPTQELGALGGFGSKVYNFSQGSILTPIVPEPATLTLLGVGLLSLRRKKPM